MPEETKPAVEDTPKAAPKPQKRYRVKHAVLRHDGKRYVTNAVLTESELGASIKRLLTLKAIEQI